jgi:nucleotide-binding universal stress UspA family protein
MADAKGTRVPTPELILVGVDFSLTSESAVDEALSLAAAPGANVHLVNVASGGTTEVVLDLLEGQRQTNPAEAERHLAGYGRSRAAAHGFAADNVRAHVRVGNPANEIVTLARELSADLVVVGTHGRTGLGRMLIGSVAEAVVKRAHCPVLVSRVKPDKADVTA